TATTALTYPIPDGSIVRLEARIVARNASTGDSATYRKVVGVKRHSGGAATLVGAVAGDTDMEDVAGWNATIDANSNDARIRVTGAAASTVVWKVRLYVETLS